MPTEAFMRCLPMLVLFLSVLCVSCPAQAFDCGRITFGTQLSELDDGNFVRYKEKGGVAYYNYVGSCRMGLHENTNPAISFAFVDGRIYARIIRTFDEDLDTMLASIQAKAGPPAKVSQDGEWTVYQWTFPDDVKSKLKINRRTGETRSAVYYEPLRAKLQGSKDTDPDEVPTE
jgi:hypothetical protein